MTTNTTPPGAHEPDTDTDQATNPSLRQMIRDVWHDVTDDGRTGIWTVVAGVGVIAGLVLMVVLVHAAIDAGADRTLRDLARTVTIPVHEYLTTHATGLPISTTVLSVGWYVAGAALLALSTIVASRGARIGWALYGLASAAMVYAATPHPARWVAVGVTGAWWVLLSVPALARRQNDTCRHIVVHTSDDEPDEA